MGNYGYATYGELVGQGLANFGKSVGAGLRTRRELQAEMQKVILQGYMNQAQQGLLGPEGINELGKINPKLATMAQETNEQAKQKNISAQERTNEMYAMERMGFLMKRLEDVEKYKDRGLDPKQYKTLRQSIASQLKEISTKAGMPIDLTSTPDANVKDEFIVQFTNKVMEDIASWDENTPADSVDATIHSIRSSMVKYGNNPLLQSAFEYANTQANLEKERKIQALDMKSKMLNIQKTQKDIAQGGGGGQIEVGPNGELRVKGKTAAERDVERGRAALPNLEKMAEKDPSKVYAAGIKMNDDGTIAVDPITGAPTVLPSMAKGLKRGASEAVTTAAEFWHESQKVKDLIDDPEISEALNKADDAGMFDQATGKWKNQVRNWFVKNGYAKNSKVNEAVTRINKLASKERKEFLGQAVTESELESVKGWLPAASDSFDTIKAKIELAAEDGEETLSLFLDTYKNDVNLAPLYKAVGIDRFGKRTKPLEIPKSGNKKQILYNKYGLE